MLVFFVTGVSHTSIGNKDKEMDLYSLRSNGVFSQYTKFGTLGIFVLLKFENELEWVNCLNSYLAEAYVMSIPFRYFYNSVLLHTSLGNENKEMGFSHNSTKLAILAFLLLLKFENELDTETSIALILMQSMITNLN